MSIKTDLIALRENQKKIEDEINFIEQSMREFKLEKDKLMEYLKEVKTQIYTLEEDTTPYIREQVELMLLRLSEYIKYEMEKTNSKKASFKIAEVVRFYDDEFFTGYVPTGNMQLYNLETGESIMSEDFYFARSLYFFGHGTNEFTKCYRTDWYVQFCDQFVSIFMEKLEKECAKQERVKLTMKAPSFTLEWE